MPLLTLDEEQKELLIRIMTLSNYKNASDAFEKVLSEYYEHVIKRLFSED